MALEPKFGLTRCSRRELGRRLGDGALLCVSGNLPGDKRPATLLNPDLKNWEYLGPFLTKECLRCAR